MELNGRQRQQFHQALLSAFPSKAKLTQMLSFELDWELDAIAGGQNQSEIIFNLLQYAKSEGHLEQLLHAAQAQNPGNPDLQHFAQSVQETPTHKTILFLAANPTDTARLRLDRELREIEESLRRSQKRDRFTLQNQGAIRHHDFHRALLDHNPQIVHFSGHGLGTRSLGNHQADLRKTSRIPESESQVPEGLVFENEKGHSRLMPAEQLSNIFKVFSEQIECVLLNACHSRHQAEAIAQHIPYVIGMRQSIKDNAAIAFATAFYDAVGAGKEIPFAFDLARTTLFSFGQQDIPELLVSP